MPSLNTFVAAGIIGGAGLAVVIVSFTSGWRSAPGVLALATATAFAVLPYGVLSDAEDSTVVQMAHRVREAYRPGDAVGTYQVFVRNLVFYTGLKQTDIIHDEHLEDWLAGHERTLVVMQTADADRLERGGLAMERLGELPYFNEGGLRVRMLLWPDPATDIEKVVLVRIDRTPTTASQD